MVFRVSPDRYARPKQIRPDLGPWFRRTKKLVRAQASRCGISESFEPEEVAGRAARECLVITDFQQPEAAAAFDSNLCRYCVPSDLHEAEPQNSAFAGDRCVLLEESSPIAVGQQGR